MQMSCASIESVQVGGDLKNGASRTSRKSFFFDRFRVCRIIFSCFSRETAPAAEIFKVNTLLSNLRTIMANRSSVA